MPCTRRSSYKDNHYVRAISHRSFLHAGKPYIIAVYPHEGWTSGGTRVCIVGMNFYEGVEVVFGTLSASAEVRRLGAMHTLLRRSAIVCIYLGTVLSISSQ